MKLFLSYAREDQQRVEPIYNLIRDFGHVPWMDIFNLVAGVEWQAQIEKEIRNSDMFLIFLSRHSVSKRGVLQREIKAALRKAEEYLPGDIYIVPIRLEDCEAPDALGKYQWIDSTGSDWETKLRRAIEEARRQRGSLQPRSTEPDVATAVAAGNQTVGKPRRQTGVRIIIAYLGAWVILAGLIGLASSFIFSSAIAASMAMTLILSGAAILGRRTQPNRTLSIIFALLAAASAVATMIEIVLALTAPPQVSRASDQEFAAAAPSCGEDPDLRCLQAGAAYGASNALANLKRCAKASIVRSDSPALQWKDVWTTSTYSFAPGGGGPGGGRDDDELKVGGWGDWYFSLIRFRLPELAAHPYFSAIALYSKENEGASVPLALDRLISNWDFPKGERLWWKDRPGQRAISTDPLPAPKRNMWYVVELTDIVGEWLQHKSENYGIQLRPTHDFGSFAVFVSSDAADKTKIPRLIFCL